MIDEETRPLKRGDFPVVYDANLVVEIMVLDGFDGLFPLSDRTTEKHHIGIFMGLDRLRTGLEDYLKVTNHSKLLVDKKLSGIDLTFDGFNSRRIILREKEQIENDFKTLYKVERIEVTKRRLY